MENNISVKFSVTLYTFLITSVSMFHSCHFVRLLTCYSTGTDEFLFDKN